MASYLTKIGDWYYYFRRTPAHMKAYDNRSSIRLALKTKNKNEALRSASIHNDFIEQYWAELIRTGSPDHDLHRFKQAQQIARAHGFAYRNIAEVAKQATNEIVTRVEMLGKKHSTPKIQALLGGAEEPQTTLAQSLELYWPLIQDRLVEKSEHQIRKYKVPRQTAFSNFISTTGDRPIKNIERNDILKFRSWLMQRIANREITGNTANKQLSAVKDILSMVGQSLEISTEFPLLFTDTKFANKKKSRPPFERAYIQKTFINSPALNSLNRDARLLLLIMIETGARPSELIGLAPEEYFLNGDIPHIWIKKNNIRSLKVNSTERQIPLVGIALEAAKQISSTGFTRYQAKPDHASGTIGKFLRENELLPSEEHSFYSFRHTFKDRLRDAEAPEEIINELMGHAHRGPTYGRGRLLEQKYEWLQRITLPLPTPEGVILT